MSLYRLLFASRVTILIYILTLSHFITCLFSLIDLDPIFKNLIYGCAGSFVAAFMGFLGLLSSCEAWASCSDFSFCGAQALVVVCGLSSCSSRALEHRLNSCGVWA